MERLAIVGTGLIGASVGLAAKRAGVAHVAGYDADPEFLAVAAERGALDEPVGSLVAAVEEADLVVVATPVATLRERIGDVLAAAGDGATVTDVGSTKSALCDAVADRVRFIGGHPVCGSEARGPASGSEQLFQGATWFLTPVAETEPERYRLLHGFVASLGAVPVAIDPVAHDRLLALTSHLPHALANVVLNHAGSVRVDGHEPLAAAGGSMRDMTRVAGANPRIWIDIFLDNAEELRTSLAEHRRRVEELEKALEARDAGWLARWIGEAGGNRRRLLAEAYEDPGAIQRVRVHVPDRPGVLSGITQALGAEKINIEDFELDHLSPERGGTLNVLVAGEESARRAADLLEAQGYSVIVSPAFEDCMRGRTGRLRCSGDLAVPGDKSISHRALLLGAIADGGQRDRGLRCLRGHAVDGGGDAGARRRRGGGGGPGSDRGSRAPRSPRARKSPSTAGTRAPSCACSRGSSPARRAASSWSATSR